MSVSRDNPRERLDAGVLRREFDQRFAAPDRIEAVEMEDFLAIRVGQRPIALRLSEVDRIEVGRKLVPLPGGDSWLLGLATCQGKLIPVHSLELALGFDRTEGEKRWLVICGREQSLGLDFDVLEGYLRIPRTEIFCTGGGNSTGTSNQQAVRGGGGELIPVVHLPSLQDAVRRRVLFSSTVDKS